jgi:glycosyltransferase involved in cell wall biosynthesis
MGRATYVAGAIESVLAQSLKRFELVVSENGEPVPEIAAAVAPYLSDPRVRHVQTGRELSAAEHHTRLIRLGAAPYVAVLHDDDRWHPDFLRDRVAFLTEHTDCGLVFSGARIVDASGRGERAALPPLAPGVHPQGVVAAALYEGNFVHVSTTLLRRAALAAVNAAFLDAFPTFDDHELWFRLALRFPVGVLARVDVDVLRHEAQLSLDRPLHSEERLRLLERFDDLIAQAGPDPVPAAARRRARARVLLSCALDAIERGDARRGRGLLARALRDRPASLLDGRALLAGVGALGGAPARRLVHAAREVSARRRPFR